MRVDMDYPILAIAPDFDEAQRHLTLLDEAAESFTFQTFDDNKTRRKRLQDVAAVNASRVVDPLSHIFNGTLEQHFDRLAELNRQGAGVFVTVNATDGKGRKLANIERIRAVWQEDDGGGLPLPLEPHIEIESSPGKHHRYVLINGLNVDEFRMVEQAIVHRYGSDPNAKDPARVLRLAGFAHCKNPDKPFMVRIVNQSGALPLSRFDAMRLLPPLKASEKPPRQPRTPVASNGASTPPAVNASAELIADLRSALCWLRADAYSDWIEIGMALHGMGDVGRGLWLEWSATSDKFDSAGAAKTWDSFKPTAINYKSVFERAQAAGWVNTAKTRKRPAAIPPPDSIADYLPGSGGSLPRPNRQRGGDAAASDPVGVSGDMDLPPELPPAFAGDDDDNRPVVRIGGDKLVSAMQEAERVLFANGRTPYFQRSGILMRIAAVDQLPESHGRITRPVGTVLLTVVDEEWLRRLLMQECRFQKWNARLEEWVDVNLPLEYPKSYISGGEWFAPVLRNVIFAPQMRLDGTVFNAYGFDGKTAVYNAADLRVEPPMARQKGEKIDPKTDAAISAARAVFVDLFESFCPESFNDLAVLVSAILSGLVAGNGLKSPGIVITSPVFGSGKGKIVDIIGLLLTGNYIPKMTLTDDQKEMRKLVFAAKLSGDRIICIDEVKGVLQCPSLDSMLTEKFISDRVLGVSKQATIDTSDTLYFALGNNISVQQDATRRFLRCYLNPRCEEPHKRAFDRDIIEHVKAKRETILTAALTLLHGFFFAGCPQSGKVLGSFEEWNRYVRNCCIWAGIGDPVETQEGWKQMDEDTLDIGALLSAWDEVFNADDDKPVPMTVANVIAHVNSVVQCSPECDKRLKDIVDKICLVKKVYDTRRLGNRIKKSEKRPVGGLMFTRGGISHSAVQWIVTRI